MSALVLCSLWFIYRMEWTSNPVMLRLEGLLQYDQAVQWLDKDFPSIQLGPPETMTQILTRLWQISPDQLQDRVIDQVQNANGWTVKTRNDWLFQTNCPLPNYIEEV